MKSLKRFWNGLSGAMKIVVVVVIAAIAWWLYKQQQGVSAQGVAADQSQGGYFLIRNDIIEPQPISGEPGPHPAPFTPPPPGNTPPTQPISPAPLPAPPSNTPLRPLLPAGTQGVPSTPGAHYTVNGQIYTVMPGSGGRIWGVPGNLTAQQAAQQTGILLIAPSSYYH